MLRLLPAALAVLALLLSAPASAQQSSPDTRIVVGVIEAPPFAMKDPAGDWHGIAIELWIAIATDLGIDYEFRQYGLTQIEPVLQSGEATVVLTAIASAETEPRVEYSHPYYSTGLGIAVPVDGGLPGWLVVLENLVSWDFLKIVLAVIVLLLLVGLAIWRLERRANPEQFAGSARNGVLDGVWWAVVTLTTVGYGDKAPKTRGGQLFAGIWMLAAVILVSVFTAQVTAALTVSSLHGRVRGPSDLVHVHVGALADSPAQLQLSRQLGVRAEGYPDFPQGLQALDDGDIDAFVASRPLLRHFIANNYAGELRVLGSTFLRQDYAIALPLGSSLRKTINGAILSFIQSDEWDRILREYLSEDQS
ncbi:MAG TPA: transporter substrate-binding domain-containing protein [Kiloniellales bacterium]|nr:transporter substrate-binding domain-containing protein [Kiloniellales bacterium]